ncbi:MAG: VWA domain-containing protein [bacterium]|nr:VWA domain-containing protein [bacterium]
MDFGAPQWLWMLAAVPATVAIVAFCWRRRLRASAAWAARGLWDRLLPTYHPVRLVIWNLLLAVALGAVALTLARPRWGASEQQVERRGVDIVMVLDTSLSMATNDVLPSRLWVAQTLIRRLVQDLPGNRVALVQAEGDGVIMVPLTTDAAVIDLLLDAVQPGSLPTPGTELRPALERAIELFPHGGDKHRALILVSDGEDHGSGLERVAAALREEGIVAFTIGVGTREGKPLELPPAERGGRLEYKRDEEGNVVVSRLVEDTLEQLSRDTGGVYLRTSGAATDPSEIVSRIQAMEKQSYGSEVVSTQAERFQWPAGAAILALVLHLSISPFSRPVRPESGGAS